MSDLVDAVRRWLPWPVYSFVGGPLDGQQREVKLIETEQGMIAPKIWAYDELPETGPVRWNRHVPVTATFKRHFYRFEPTRSANEGHYVLIAEARR